MKNFLKDTSPLFFIPVIISGFLYLHSIDKYMLLIGDQAWFYISARDMILSGEIPLLGIESSHPWIHQGPLWTYMLSPMLVLFDFHPLGGSYLTALLGLISVIMIFFLGKGVWDSRFGLIVMVLYTISPLVTYHVRMPYHTTPIPLFVILLFFFITKWVKGRIMFFPLVLGTMSVLYNLELATVIFWPVIFGYIIFGASTKKDFVMRIDRKTVSLSIVALVIPMVPVLIYDIQNGFMQTVVFAGWFFYKGFQLIGILPKSAIDESSVYSASMFFFDKYSELVFPFNKAISALFFTMSIFISIILILKRKLVEILPIVLITLIGLLAYFVSGIPSEAYLVMLFPGLIFMVAMLVANIKNKYLLYGLLIVIGTSNIYFLISTNYLTKGAVVLQDKIDAARKISEIVQGGNYSLIYEGPGQEFKSSVMPYEYLTWWLSKREDRHGEKKTILIIQENDTVSIEEIK